MSCSGFLMFLPSCLHLAGCHAHMHAHIHGTLGDTSACKLTPHLRAHPRTDLTRTHARTRRVGSGGLVLALHLPPLYSCPSSTHTRERERGRGRKERYLGERATYTDLRTIERKQAFCASLPVFTPIHSSACLSFSPSSLSVLSLACTHTQNYARRAGRSAGSDACPLSLYTHMDDGGTSPPHVHAAMLTRASSAVRDPALARIPRRYLYLNVNKLDHLPETIFRNLTSLR